MKQAQLVERARGALLGLAVGDALGAAVDWKEPEQIRTRFGGPLRDMVASPMWSLGEWTDATAMAVALAESLAERGGYEPDDALARYVLWARSRPKEIGVTVGTVLRSCRTAEQARAAAQRFHHESGGRSAGNGSLMRAAPIGIRYRRDAGAIERISRADSALTHHDPLAGDACVLFNLTLAALLNGRRPPRSTSEVGRAATGALEASPEELLSEVQRRIGFVLTALRVGYSAALGRDSFEEAVVFAVNLGGDADTNGAIAGALAGARFGASAIPQRWLEPLHRRDHISGLAQRLLRT